jgi:hypothetical protein
MQWTSSMKTYVHGTGRITASVHRGNLPSGLHDRGVYRGLFTRYPGDGLPITSNDN